MPVLKGSRAMHVTARIVDDESLFRNKTKHNVKQAVLGSNKISDKSLDKN